MTNNSVISSPKGEDIASSVDLRLEIVGVAEILTVPYHVSIAIKDDRPDRADKHAPGGEEVLVMGGGAIGTPSLKVDLWGLEFGGLEGKFDE